MGGVGAASKLISCGEDSYRERRAQANTVLRKGDSSGGGGRSRCPCTLSTKDAYSGQGGHDSGMKVVTDSGTKPVTDSDFKPVTFGPVVGTLTGIKSE